MNIYSQGRWKQFPNGQAQLDVGGEAVKNLRVKCAAKFWSLLFLQVLCVRTYIRTLPVS